MKVLIVASDKGGHFTPFIEEQIVALMQVGVEVERFGVMRKGAMGYLMEMPRLCRVIREVKPDVIHAHYGLSGLLAGLAVWVSVPFRHGGRIPVVTTYHGSDINEPKVLRLSRWAMRLSAWNIFVSQRNADIATKMYADKNYSLIPCGVNLTDDQLLTREEARQQCALHDAQCVIWNGEEQKKCSFRDIQDASLILFAGAFDNAVKDAALAKKAVDVLNAQNAAVHTQLIELRGYAREEVNRLMCAADCLLLTSKREGSPQVIKEAMACGCPIVSVDVGDVAERIAGIDGCYVVPTRNPQEIANFLTRALSFSNFQEIKSHTSACMGRTAARRHLQEMGLTNFQVVRALQAVYSAVLAQYLCHKKNPKST